MSGCRATDGAALVTATGEIGVYVHVPFCLRKCPYCDFAVTVTQRIPHREYADALIRELACRMPEQQRVLRSIYFGGGTPSLLEPTQLARIITAITQRCGQPTSGEITVEANPECVSQSWVDAMVDAGVTRLSLGAQSMTDAALTFLGRNHQAEDIERAIGFAREAGISRISVDLIYGVPGFLEHGVSDAVALGSLPGVEHVSAYELTYEPQTAFDLRRQRGQLVVPPDLALVTVADQVRDALQLQGYAQYEVSSFARAGSRSVHNAGYWTGHEYLGLGTGAHSLLINEGVPMRMANPRGFRHYMSGEKSQVEVLDAATHVAELVMTGMRTTDGVCVAELSNRVPVLSDRLRSHLQDLAATWFSRGHAVYAGTRIVPTQAGLRHADLFGADAFALLIDDRNERATEQ